MPDRNKEQPGESGGTGQARILIVEDEERLQQVLARTLEQGGYIVTTAATAEQAVAIVAHERPDLLVLDINLPDDTGWGVLRRLGAYGISCATLHTIVISASRADRRRLAEFQPWAFLAKPFSVGALRNLIADALAQVPG